MSVSRYAPGTWLCVVAPGFVAFMDGQTPIEIGQSIWDAAGRGEDVISHLEIVATDRFDRLAPFALVRFDDKAANVIVRGGMEIEIDGRERKTVTAPDAMTWSEASVAQPSSITVRAPDYGTISEPLPRPLLGGIVSADAVQIEVPAAPEEPPPATVHQRVEPAQAGDGLQESQPQPAPTQAADDAAPALADDAAPDPDPAPALAADVDPAQIPDVSTPAPAVTVPLAPPIEAEPALAAVPASAESQLYGRTVMIDDVMTARAQLAEINRARHAAAQDSSVITEVPLTRQLQVVVSTGMRLALDRPILVGQQPDAGDPDQAHVVELDSDELAPVQIEIRPGPNSYGTIVDKSLARGARRAATVITVPGGEPTALRPGESVRAPAGTTVQLGNGFGLVLEAEL